MRLNCRAGRTDWSKGFASGGRRRSGSSVTGLARHPTTIELPHYDVGRWAVLELLRMIESGRDRPAPHVALPCLLFEGGRRPVSRAGIRCPSPVISI